MRHETLIRVRYAETDQMRYLYYGRYAEYFEVGRVEMLRSIGLTYKQMEEEWGVMMPVVSMEVRYLRPAFYDDLLTVRTELRALPDKFITFHVEIFNEAKKLINAGKVKLCFWDNQQNKTILAPDPLMERLIPFFEKT